MVTAVLQRSNPHQPRTRGRFSQAAGRLRVLEDGVLLRLVLRCRWRRRGAGVQLGGERARSATPFVLPPSGGPGVDAWPNHTRTLLSMTKAAGPLRRAGEPSSLRLIGPGLESLVFLLFFLVFLRARARTARKAFIHAGFKRFLSYPNPAFFPVGSPFFPVYLPFFRCHPQFSPID